MYKNYFKTLLRNMRKNKLHTTINVAGMAVAFTVSILLFLTVVFMFSFDQFHANKSQVFKVYDVSNGPDGERASVSVSYPLRKAILDEKIGIEKATLIRNAGRGVTYNEKELELDVKLVDNDFFNIFSFPVVKGNATNPLGNTSDVVLSEHAAKTIFNTVDPIGKTIRVKIEGTWLDLVVSSVLKDFPENSSLNYDVLARTELHPSYAAAKNAWDNEHSVLYAMTAPNANKEAVEAGMRRMYKKYQLTDIDFMKAKGFIPDQYGFYSSPKLLPLTEMHFSPKMGNGNAVNKSAIYILLLIGVMILLIACFNFVNLNIGNSFTRAKEMGIRKCLGAGKKQVWLQVWGESFFVCLVSMLIAIIASAILIGVFNKMHVSRLDGSMLYDPFTILMLVGILVVVSFVAGGYPSSLISKLRTVEILKGKFSLKSSGMLRNALIVVQFVIACVLICTTAIIYQQFQHLRTASLGYTTSSLISLPLHNGSKSQNLVEQLRLRLAAQPSVVTVSGSNINLGVGKDGGTSKIGNGFEYKGRSVRTNMLFADYDFLKTLNIKPLEGRDFSSDYVSDTSNSVIITESMAKQLTDDKNALGLTFQTDTAEKLLTVVGVIPDFHLYSMHEKSEALTIVMSKGSASYALIKVNTNNPTATMDLVKTTYAQLEPGMEFKGTYVDENIERWYNNEKEMARMFSVSAAIAIILSCMGLFGIALIAIKQRVKEIGVRKVLGASVTGIATMVTKDFIKPVLLAIVIAIPIAWWAMGQWLQDFVYRVQINWVVFAVAGIIALSIAILTISGHAIKAALANPVKSLRTE